MNWRLNASDSKFDETTQQANSTSTTQSSGASSDALPATKPEGASNHPGQKGQNLYEKVLCSLCLVVRDDELE